MWIGASKLDLMRFPQDVIQGVGLTLMRVQYGDRPPGVKPLRGFGSADVLEVVEDDDGRTFRAVYTVRFQGRIYVLHAFEKKSKHGIKTPKKEIDLVKQRLEWARMLHAEWEKTHAKDK